MTAPALAVRHRLAGVDAARGVALIGMMTVHVLPGPRDAGGSWPLTAWVYRVAEGRSAALFAVLAGVSLVLSGATRKQIAIRAVLVAAVGLPLGMISGPVAIILTIYGVLFVLALPFLRLRASLLAGLAAAWALLSPLLSQFVRGHGLSAAPSNPAWSDLAHPLALTQNLLLTGYYPALTWLPYLLAGLAAGRVLAGRTQAEAGLAGRWIALTGLAVAIAGWTIGTLTVRAAGGVAALTSRLEPSSVLTGRGPHLLDETFYGTTPLTSWWWTGVGAPHSGGIGDLVQTTGSALVLLGVALLVASYGSMWIRPLAAAGAMTLSLYTLHVLIMDVVASIPAGQRPPAWPLLIAQVVLALAAALAWGAPKERGPLEELVSGAVRALAGRRDRRA